MALDDDSMRVLLQERLAALADETRAHNAYVLDASANFLCAGTWGAARGTTSDTPIRAVEVTERALAGLARPLSRGGSIQRALEEEDAYIRSFASVYVLLLQFPVAFDVGAVKWAVARALPRIEALTLALPPPEGPGRGTAEGFGIA